MSLPTDNNAKLEDWLLESIALVRSRKSRPDVERIAKAMQKNHAIEASLTEKLLSNAVRRGMVVQTNFKGAISYRIAFKAGKASAPNKVGKAGPRSVRLCKRITKAINELDRNDNGVSFESIERFIASRWATTSSVLTSKIRLRSALRDGVANSTFIKTPEKTYKLVKSLQQSPTCEELEEDEEDDSDIQCDFCQHGADRNQAGVPEELLICKDCGNQAHPSCLGYSLELVEQIRIDDSWQCIDCKACIICDGTGDPDTLLFCDACDKGYHMLCHTPKLDQMPSGKWVCSLCSHKDEQMDMFVEDNGEILVIDDEEVGRHENSVATSPRDKYRISSNGVPTMVVLPRDPPITDSSSSTTSPTNVSAIHSAMSLADIKTSSTPPAHQARHMTLTPFPHGFQRKHSTNCGNITFVHSNAARIRHTAPQPSTFFEKAAVTKAQMQLKRNQQAATNNAQQKGSNRKSSHNLGREKHSSITDTVLSRLPTDVADWIVSDVVYYLRAHSFIQESKLFEEQEIDGKALLLMSRNDVLTGLQLKLGPALKIYHIHITKLQSRTDFIGL